ncbi:MAG: hypothetical protein LQ338_008273, partial [Usnochroma carphineum]
MTGRLVPRDPIGDQNGANGSVVVQEQTGIPSPTLNPDVARSYSPTLWDEIYDSFNASIASPDLRDIAKSFRQQSRSPPARFTEIPAGDPENSREWHMCRQIIQSAEAKKNGNNSGAGPLKRKIRDAYNEITVSVHDQEIKAGVVEGLAGISRLLCRYAVFEAIYLRDGPSLQESLKSELTAAVKKLYLAIFTYLVELTSHLSRSST